MTHACLTDTISRLFPNRCVGSRFVMTRAARKPLVKHAVLWLAALMILWPVEPQRACACDRASAGTADFRTQVQHSGDGRLCCRGANVLGAVESSCRCKPGVGVASQRKCCRTASASADRSRDVCCCGSGCKCQVSGRPDQPRDVPTPITDDGCRRLDVARPLPIATFAARSAGLTGCCIEQPRNLIFTTAIDRCRMLSRFTI